MSHESVIIEKQPSQNLPFKALEKEEKKDQKSFFFRDIEMSALKEILLKEIDVPKLKESLVDDIKAALLKEIDISGIKEALLKEIYVKDLIGGKDNSSDVKDIETTSAKKMQIKKEPVNLPGYKYGLVDDFIKNHQEILSIYETIISNAKEKDYAILPLMLSKFSRKCFTHFNDEEELYTFTKALAGSRSEVERRIATECSAEMKNLSLEFFTILNQSKFIPVNDNTVAGFIDEFSQLGKILQKRIDREEVILFPMYENSRKIVDIC